MYAGLTLALLPCPHRQGEDHPVSPTLGGAVVDQYTDHLCGPGFGIHPSPSPPNTRFRSYSCDVGD